MFYVKTRLNNHETLVTDLTPENVFTRCPICGKEIAVDLARNFRGNEQTDCTFANTDVVCDECSEELKHARANEEATDYIDEILSDDALCTMGKIAEDYGMTEREQLVIIVHLGILVAKGDHWAPGAKIAGRGYIEMRKCPHGVPVPLWTQKGRLFLYEQLKEIEVLPEIEKDDEEDE